MNQRTLLFAVVTAVSSVPLCAQTVVQSFPMPYGNAFVGGVAYERITDTVWVVDETNNLFTHLTRTGTQIAQFPTPTVTGIASPLPIGVKVHPRTGNLWVVDEAEVVYECTQQGTVLRSWSCAPTITDASAIALDLLSASVYVGNDSGRIIGEFDENGASLRTFSVLGAGSSDPDGLAYNMVTQTFYLGEDTQDRIIEVDRNGLLVNSWSTVGLVSPEGLDVDTKTGTLFVGGGFVQRSVVELAGIVPVPTGSVTLYGTGCPDSGGTVPHVSVSEVPTVGRQLTVAVQGSPTVTTLAWFVLGTQQISMPLDPFGAIGCTLYADPFVIAPPFVVNNGRAGFYLTHPTPVPPGPYTLTCIFLPDGTVNGIGLAAGNGVQIVYQ